MTAARNLRCLTLSAFTATALIAAGCASAPPRAERYVPPPVGSTWTHKVTSSGSFGSGTSEVVTRRGPDATWEGRSVYRFESLNQQFLQGDGAELIAITNPGGQVQMRLDPPAGYQWPLEVGKTWTTNHVMRVTATGQNVPFSVTWKVEAYEDVTVAAGTFKAWRVTYADTFGEKQVIWSVPDKLGVMPKRTYERSAAYAQGGAGTRVMELLTVPAVK